MGTWMEVRFMYWDLNGDVTHLDGVVMQISGHGLG